MPEALVHGSAKSKIVLIMEGTFEQWQETQSTALQQWFKANDYKGKGLLILPHSGADGIHAVFGITDLNDFFLAGDLPTLLPEDTYEADFSPLVNEASIDEEMLELLKFRFAVSWGLASYQFEQYKKTARRTSAQKAHMEFLQRNVISRLHSIR